MQKDDAEFQASVAAMVRALARSSADRLAMFAHLDELIDAAADAEQRKEEVCRDIAARMKKLEADFASIISAARAEIPIRWSVNSDGSYSLTVTHTINLGKVASP